MKTIEELKKIDAAIQTEILLHSRYSAEDATTIGPKLADETYEKFGSDEALYRSIIADSEKRIVHLHSRW